MPLTMRDWPPPQQQQQQQAQEIISNQMTFVLYVH